MAAERTCAAVIAAAVLGAALAAGSAAASDVHSAAASGDTARLRRLLKKKPALANAADGIGRTPLHWAAAKGHEEAAKLLLGAGAKVSAKDAVGWTPLHCAASAGHAGAAKLLIEAKAPVAAKDAVGATPLDRAIRGNHGEVAGLLMKHGAGAVVAKIPDAGEVDGLVKQLGDESWHKREAAHRRLVELGFFSIRAISTAVDSDDAEVVWRAKEIRASLEKAYHQRVLPSDFWVAGPFAHTEKPDPLDIAYPPEKMGLADLDLTKELAHAGKKFSWSRPWPLAEGAAVNLDLPWGPHENCVGYAMTWVFSPEERELTMLLGSDDAVKLWIGGKLAHTNNVKRACSIDQDKVPVTLSAGWNRVLVKVVEYSIDWAFAVRFVDSEKAQPADVIFDATRGGSVKFKPDQVGPEGAKPYGGHPGAAPAPGPGANVRPGNAGAVIRIGGNAQQIQINVQGEGQVIVK